MSESSLQSEGKKLRSSSPTSEKKIKPIGIVIKALLISFCYIMLHTFVKTMIDFRALTEEHKLKIRDINDLWLVVIAGVLCRVLNVLFEMVFKKKIVDNILAQNRPDSETKIKKNLKQGKDILYYGIISVNILLFSHPLIPLLDRWSLCKLEQEEDAYYSRRQWFMQHLRQRLAIHHP